jgi:pimeloyl-ACP methyl ester carboxylesterase
MAIRNDPDVAAYVVLDSATYVPGRQPDAALRAVRLPILGIGFARVLGSQVAPKKIRQGLLEQFPYTPPPEAFLAERIALWNNPKVTHTIAAETLGAFDDLAAMSPRYPTIQRPVFILAQSDRELRREAAKRLHGDIKGSSLELLPGTGHYVQFEKADEVIAAVRRAAAVQ